MSYEYSEGYKIRNQAATHFLTFTIEGWVDIFSRKEYRDMIIESFVFCRYKKQLKIHAFVIMTNHIHTIWTAGNGNLSDVIRDFKTHTSKLFVNYIIESPKESRKEWLIHLFKSYGNESANNKFFKVWKKNSHPE
jgi:putative transposase